MPEKVLETKRRVSQAVLKAMPKKAKASASKEKRPAIDPWYLNERTDEADSERGGINWLPRDKARNWLRDR